MHVCYYYLRVMWLDAKLWVLRGNQQYMLKRLKIIAQVFERLRVENIYTEENLKDSYHLIICLC